MAALGEDLLTTVNKLQDLVFNTIGSDSLDLPQIVCISFWLGELIVLALTDRIFRLLSVPSPRANLPSLKTSSAETFYRAEPVSALVVL